MYKTITPADMKRVEGRVMAETGVTGDRLMARAAAHVARAARGMGAKRALCVCGTGNNGGDGLAAMRLLAGDAAFSGVCWLLPGPLSHDARRELDRLRACGNQVEVITLGGDCPPLPNGVELIIDAMFGTGLSRPLEGVALDICHRLNESRLPVVAVDTPPG